MWTLLCAGSVSGFLSFFCPYNPLWLCYPVRRLQKKMELRGKREREREFSLCFPPPQMVLITGPLKPVLCQLVLAVHFSPLLLCLVVGGLGELPDFLLASMCVCVSSDGGRDFAYRRRGTKTPNRVKTHFRPSLYCETQDLES